MAYLLYSAKKPPFSSFFSSPIFLPLLYSSRPNGASSPFIGLAWGGARLGTVAGDPSAAPLLPSSPLSPSYSPHTHCARAHHMAVRRHLASPASSPSPPTRGPPPAFSSPIPSLPRGASMHCVGWHNGARGESDSPASAHHRPAPPAHLPRLESGRDQIPLPPHARAARCALPCGTAAGSTKILHRRRLRPHLLLSLSPLSRAADRWCGVRTAIPILAASLPSSMASPFTLSMCMFARLVVRRSTE